MAVGRSRRKPSQERSRLVRAVQSSITGGRSKKSVSGGSRLNMSPGQPNACLGLGDSRVCSETDRTEVLTSGALRHRMSAPGC